MTAACFNISASFGKDWVAVSSPGRPILSFGDAGISGLPRGHFAGMNDERANHFGSIGDDTEIGPGLSSSLGSALEEAAMETLKTDLNNADSKGEETQSPLFANGTPDAIRSSKDQPNIDSAHCPDSPEYSATLEYGRKLGYDADLIHSVLKRRGSNISRDQLLKELIENDRPHHDPGYCLSPIDGPSAGPVDNDLASGKDKKPAVDLDPSMLRPIIIDGSNVAMSHGNKKVFSCRGIGIAVDWFRQRGHREITVFVPQWRKENTKQASQITNPEILSALEQEKIVVFTPSRRVNNKRITCYDDRYILNLAAENRGIVVSNDTYRDLLLEKPEFKKVIEERLLMYSFVNDRFMPPDDPLGRHGPGLDNFLRRTPALNSPLLQPCPYGRKCTYGNKCKFGHPERSSRTLLSAWQQIGQPSPIKIKDPKQGGFNIGKQLHSDGKSPFNPLPSKSPSEMVDLSPLAISLLSCDRSSSSGLIRHSLPLPWPSTLDIKHDSVRPVRSDPLRLFRPTGCSGHLDLAKKLSRENCLVRQQHGDYDHGSSSEKQWDNPNKKIDAMKQDTRHALLCRTPSVGTHFMAPNSHFSMLKSAVGPSSDSVSCSGNTSFFEKKWNENGLDLIAEHNQLSRMHSAPPLFQSASRETDRAASGPSAQLHGQGMLLHRVPTTPFTKEPVMSSFFPLETDTNGDNYQQNSRGMQLQGQDFLMSGARGNMDAIGDHCLDNSWMHPLNSANASLSEFPQMKNISDPCSQNLSKFCLGQHNSTFHFGQNSSYRFVPALRDNVVVPPCGDLRIPPGFSIENSVSARDALFVKLCMLFDAEDVRRIMVKHPNEMDIKALCGHLLQLDQQKVQQKQQQQQQHPLQHYS